jgi:3',5'-cyclic AMP phosphodiesterase CpdA
MSIKKIIHLSDLHIQDRGKEYQWAHRVFASIRKYYKGHPVLITGDITDDAKEGQMESARSLLDYLAETNPVLVVPGNHDYAWKGILAKTAAWDEWMKQLGAPLGWGDRKGINWLSVEVDPKVDGLGVWEDEDNDFIYFGVDSGDPANKAHTAKGYISETLAQVLKSELDKHEGKCRVVMLHHHPFDDGMFMKLEGVEHFLSAVKSNCEILLFGHDHHLGLWHGKNGIPMTVASHKSTGEVFEHHLMINVIQVKKSRDGTRHYWHRLELV